MKTLKKTLCLVLAVVMALGVLVLPASAAEAEKTETQKAQEAAYATLKKYGIMLGSDIGAELDRAVTRAEAATIAYRIMTGDNSGDAKNAVNFSAYSDVFTDIKSEDKMEDASWAAGYIGYAVNAGLVQGHGDNTFAPNDPVCGDQLVKIMLRCLGYGENDEYIGEGWSNRALAQAQQIGMLRDILIEDMTEEISRGDVARIVVNAINCSMVKEFNGTYSEYADNNGRPAAPNTPGATLNPHLVTYTPPTTTPAAADPDKWGAPRTTTTVSDEIIAFNHPIPSVVHILTKGGTTTTVDKPLDEFWGTKTECDVAKAAGFEDDIELDSYTNGLTNKNLKDGVNPVANELKTKIEPLDTVHTIGHQGRWTRVYKDRIVYVDTFLGKVTSTSDEIKDTGGHVIEPASAQITIYSNKVANGDGNLPLEVEGTISAKNDKGLVKGDMVRLQVYTKANNSLTGLTIDNVASVEKVTATNVTIQAVLVDSENGNQKGLVGFKGSDGKDYLYNYTFGYNGGSSVQRIAEVNIGSTWGVYLDTKGNVLGLVPSTTAVNVGVVQSVDALKVAAHKYALEFTVLLPNKQTTKFTAVLPGVNGADPDGFFTSLDDAETEIDFSFSRDRLIRFENAPAGNPDWAGYMLVQLEDGRGEFNGDNGILSGEANAIFGVDHDPNNADPTVDDETVFFIANYTYRNSTQRYEFTGYDVVTGFKNINDLMRDFRLSDNVDGNRSNTIHVEFLYDKDEGADHVNADYVLVLYANRQDKPDTYKVDNFAYLTNAQQFSEIGDDYRIYRNAIINGVAGSTLKVTNAAAVNGIVNYGLYKYENETTNGFDRVTWVSNTGAQAFEELIYAAARGSWTYEDGVIYTNGNTSNRHGDPDRFLTVADDVKVFVVNPTTGVCYATSSDMETIERIYGNGTDGRNCEIAYQLNAKGYISLVYVIDRYDEDNPEVKPDAPTPQPTKLNVKINPVDKYEIGYEGEETLTGTADAPIVFYVNLSVDCPYTLTADVSPIWVGSHVSVKIELISNAHSQKTFRVTVKGLKAGEEATILIGLDRPETVKTFDVLISKTVIDKLGGTLQYWNSDTTQYPSDRIVTSVDGSVTIKYVVGEKLIIKGFNATATVEGVYITVNGVSTFIPVKDGMLDLTDVVEAAVALTPSPLDDEAAVVTVEITDVIVNPLTFSVYDVKDTDFANPLDTFYFEKNDVLDGKTILHVDPEKYYGLAGDVGTGTWVKDGLLEFKNGDIIVKYKPGVQDSYKITVREPRKLVVTFVNGTTKLGEDTIIEGQDVKDRVVPLNGLKEDECVSKVNDPDHPAWNDGSLIKIGDDLKSIVFVAAPTSDAVWNEGKRTIPLTVYTAKPAEQKDYEDAKDKTGDIDTDVVGDLGTLYKDMGITVTTNAKDHKITVSINKSMWYGYAPKKDFLKLLRDGMDGKTPFTGKANDAILIGVSFSTGKTTTADAIHGATLNDGEETRALVFVADDNETLEAGFFVLYLKLMDVDSTGMDQAGSSPKLPSSANLPTYTVTYAVDGVQYEWTVEFVFEAE